MVIGKLKEKGNRKYRDLKKFFYWFEIWNKIKYFRDFVLFKYLLSFFVIIMIKMNIG